jgi:hypothetical protein
MRFVVTGCGCSGTKWVAEALTVLDLQTGHARTYGPDLAIGARPRWRAFHQGDASWLAEPFVPELLEQRVPVVRVVRDPLRVVQSAFADGFLVQRRRERLGPSAQWAFAKLPELAAVAESPLDLAVRWVARWDHRSASDDRVLTVRVEDGGSALRAILKHVGRSHLGIGDRADKAAARGRSTNTHRAIDYPRPGWPEILATRDGDKLAARALLLGYEVPA